jgi:hypothetical protein
LKLIWIKELDIPGLERLAFQFDVIEFSTCIKPWILNFFLKQYQRVFYIDPDIMIYSSLDEIFNQLNVNSSIILTPHTLSPIDDGNKPGDLEFLRFGSFNLGFIGVHQDENAIAFLNWWSERLFKYGFYEPQLGLAVDQKWIDLVPCYFSGVVILKDRGLNVAFWNLHERILTKSKESEWLVNGTNLLKFVHFSSFDVNKPEVIAGKQSRFAAGSRPDFIELAQDYAQLLREFDTGLNNEKYCFDFFNDGQPISPSLRRFYSCLSGKIDQRSPFLKDSAIRKFAHQNHLLSSRESVRMNFKSLNQFGRVNKLFLIFLKVVLRVLGPDRYFALMRYFAHISSLRNQSDMFN